MFDDCCNWSACEEVSEAEAEATLRSRSSSSRSKPPAATGLGIIDLPGCKWVCSLYTKVLGLLRHNRLIAILPYSPPSVKIVNLMMLLADAFNSPMHV